MQVRRVRMARPNGAVPCQPAFAPLSGREALALDWDLRPRPQAASQQRLGWCRLRTVTAQFTAN